MKILLILLSCVGICLGNGCVLRSQWIVTNAALYPIEITTYQSLFPDTCVVHPLETKIYDTAYFIVPPMKIFVPLTGKTYKYYLETGSLVTHMAFYDDGIIGLQVFPDGVKVEGFMMITPDESGWIYLPRKRFSQNKRCPRVFSEDEWSKRKLISREQMRMRLAP